jgi:hypothetical protein
MSEDGVTVAGERVLGKCGQVSYETVAQAGRSAVRVCPVDEVGSTVGEAGSGER